MDKNNNIHTLDRFHVYVMKNAVKYFFYDYSYERTIFLVRYREQIVGAWRLKK